jgi:hypothetical protein
MVSGHWAVTLDKNSVRTRSLEPADGFCLVVAKGLLARLTSASVVINTLLSAVSIRSS